jgi:hypothetical protein
MPYKEFRVTVDQDKTHIARPSGVETEGDVRMSPLTEQTIRLFAKWVAEDRDCISREVFEVLGCYLFDVLFDKDTRTVFKTEYDRIRKSGDMALRVILEFKREARDLAILPWEYIYYPDSDEGRGFFIATDNQLILTRHVPLVIKDEPSLAASPCEFW